MRFVPLALVVLAACAGSARASNSAPKMAITPNWSGYVARAPVKPTYQHPYFTDVTGTWTVPAAKCNGKKDAGASSTAWVGLGGYTTQHVAEIGTNSNCSKTSKPYYFAWFELVPYPAYNTFPSIKSKVSAGDTMTGLVHIISPKKIELKIINKTAGWTFDKTIDYISQDNSTAEWIVSAPANCVYENCTQASLANFGAVEMRDISAVGRRTKGNLNTKEWHVTPVRLVPSRLLVPTLTQDINGVTVVKHGRARTQAGATPGPPSRDGRSFKLKWVAVATRGV